MATLIFFVSTVHDNGINVVALVDPLDRSTHPLSVLPSTSQVINDHKSKERVHKEGYSCKKCPNHSVVGGGGGFSPGPVIL